MYLRLLCVCTYEALVITQIEFCRGSSLYAPTPHNAICLFPEFYYYFSLLSIKSWFLTQNTMPSQFPKKSIFSYTAQAQIDSIYRFNLFVMDGGDRPIKIGGGILPKAPSFQPCFFPSIETSSFMFSMLQFWFIERYPFVYEDVFDKSF